RGGAPAGGADAARRRNRTPAPSRHRRRPAGPRAGRRDVSVRGGRRCAGVGSGRPVPMSTPSGGARRLGVRTALVDGEWIAGDVEVAADGTVAAVGVGGGSGAVGTGVAIPGLVDLQ